MKMTLTDEGATTDRHENRRERHLPLSPGGVFCRRKPGVGAIARLPVMLILLFLMRTAGAATWELEKSGSEIKRLADSVLLLTSFTLLPDITTSSLSISDQGSNDPGLAQTALGGGFTVSDEVPLYLEGNFGFGDNVRGFSVGLAISF